MAYQLADSMAGMAWSFILSGIILFTLSAIGRYIPCMRLRATAEEERLGIDDVEIGEFAYDYVELIRDVLPPTGEVEYEADVQSQRSHSQATMFRPEKNTYPLRALSRGPGDHGPAGIAQ
jgi:Amt family ammonium transporter